MRALLVVIRSGYCSIASATCFAADGESAREKRWGEERGSTADGTLIDACASMKSVFNPRKISRVRERSASSDGGSCTAVSPRARGDGGAGARLSPLRAPVPRLTARTLWGANDSKSVTGSTVEACLLKSPSECKRGRPFGLPLFKSFLSLVD